MSVLVPAGYLRLVSAQWRLLGFGFLAAFMSSFGQTYFIGVFGPAIQGEYGLSHTLWGALYMLGTLASAAVLPWTGRLIDRVDLRRYALAVCALLVAACSATATVTGPATLVVAIFLLRHSGQGLMSHVAVTTMARYFDAERGRAIAVSTLGFSVGEAFLPFLAVTAIAVIGWRWSYGAAATLSAIALAPVLLWLLAGHGERHRAHEQRLAAPMAAEMTGPPSWSRHQVLHDPRFYLLLPGLLAPSMILTAMFFHHLNLADAKGWSHEWITGSYVVYAVVTTLASLSSGPLIDRIGAVRLVPFMLVPLALAMVTVGLSDSPWSAWPYLMMAGASVGMAHTAASAMWAELYGVGHLGAIKSLAAALGVFSSALGPVILGSLMDLGLAIDSACVLFGGWCIAGSVLMGVALRRPASAANG
jgi:MFS family permease